MHQLGLQLSRIIEIFIYNMSLSDSKNNSNY